MSWRVNSGYDDGAGSVGNDDTDAGIAPAAAAFGAAPKSPPIAAKQAPRVLVRAKQAPRVLVRAKRAPRDLVRGNRRPSTAAGPHSPRRKRSRSRSSGSGRQRARSTSRSSRARSRAVQAARRRSAASSSWEGEGGAFSSRPEAPPLVHAKGSAAAPPWRRRGEAHSGGGEAEDPAHPDPGARSSPVDVPSVSRQPLRLGFDLGGVLMEDEYAIPGALEAFHGAVKMLGEDNVFIISRVGSGAEASRQSMNMRRGQLERAGFIHSDGWGRRIDPATSNPANLLFCTQGSGQSGKGIRAADNDISFFIDDQLRHLRDIYDGRRRFFTELERNRAPPSLILLDPKRKWRHDDAREFRDSVKNGGTMSMVEPPAGDRWEHGLSVAWRRAWADMVTFAEWWQRHGGDIGGTLPRAQQAPHDFLGWGGDKGPHGTVGRRAPGTASSHV
jgi:hypothetical protein